MTSIRGKSKLTYCVLKTTFEKFGEEALDRHHELTKYLTKEQIGIEVGPWFSPIAPKREGYQCLALDLFDSETLREKAKIDPFIPNDKISNIEEVDLVGSSIEIENIAEKNGLLEKIDYILSSHNFEHLPNPVRFLQGCDRVLKPGGMLSMAIPDLRACFDYFRSPTSLTIWLEAYFAAREKPTFTQIFEQSSLHSQYQRNGEVAITFFLADDPAYITPLKTLQESFDRWKRDLANQETTYCDVHCSTFTPSSFELLISDLQYLGLTKLQLIEISATNGCEFYAHLQRPTHEESMAIPDPDYFYERRKSLLHRVNSERGANSLEAFRIGSALNSAHAKMGEQQREIEQNQQRIQQLETLIDSIISSHSWRLASPLRLISAWLRRLGGGIGSPSRKGKY